MKNKEYFGKKIKFEEILESKVFVTQKSCMKIYTDNFIHKNNKDYYNGCDIENTLCDNVEPFSCSSKICNSCYFGIEIDKEKDSYKKLVFKKHSGEGIIIGNCIKWEGKYYHSLNLDEEPSSLKKERCFKFFKVATSMNKFVLVDKGSNYEIE